MPASSAMRASRRLSGHEPDQRSGTSVTARPDEQFGPNKPILNALALYMLMRSRMDVWGASNFGPRLVGGDAILHRVAPAVNGHRHGACAPSPACGGGRGWGSHEHGASGFPLSGSPAEVGFVRLRPINGAEIGQARFGCKSGGEGARAARAGQVPIETHISPHVRSVLADPPRPV